MIEKVADIDELKPFDNSDLFFVRIMSLAKAYGCEYPFARFYRQIDDNDKILTLSTCDNTGTKRVAVHAKMINIEYK